MALAPNATLYPTTSANGVESIIFDLKNTGSTTNVYIVKRYDVQLNTGASAYFCFAGNCYPDFTMTSPDADTLLPGQSASELPGLYKLLTTDLQEGPAVGQSIVKYTIKNVANANDTAQITLKYNYSPPVGLKESVKNLSSFELFPNPAKETTSIRINSPKVFETSVILFNSLGEVVYQKEVSINEGKNKIDMDLQNLPSGVYFATVKTAAGTLTKRLVIN